MGIADFIEHADTGKTRYCLCQKVAARALMRNYKGQHTLFLSLRDA